MYVYYQHFTEAFMKTRKTEVGVLSALFSTVSLLAVFLLFLWLYTTTRYLPFLLIGLLAALPAGMNLLVIVFDKDSGERIFFEKA